MELRMRLRGRVASAALALLTVAACGVKTPLPPLVAVGDPIIGVNPQTGGTPGARSTVTTYGPWTVPGATGPGHEQAGMIDDLKLTTTRPCTDCYITSAKPQLKYRDGTVANTDTGLWLHHFALFNSGAVDVRCGTAPQQLLGEIFFNGSNERTQGQFPAGVGYPSRPLDRWALVVDLMNTGPTAKDVVFEMTYEWVPASTPGMHSGKPVWIDITNTCADSRFPAGTGQYSRKNTWTVTAPGRVMGLASHLHDGGTHITLRNLTTGEMICDSAAHYGGPGYEEPMGADAGHDHGGAMHPTVHLSGVDQCVSRSIDRPLAVIERGQQLEIEAFYDADAHPHSPDEPVMGVFFMFVAQ